MIEVIWRFGSPKEVDMGTYRKDLERNGWHRPWPLRIVSVVVSVTLLLTGWVAWALEQDKGGWEGTDLGHFTVEEGYDEFGSPTHALVRGEGGEVLFESTSVDEVDAWIESQRNRDFTVPILLLAGGIVLLLVGLAPSPRTRDLGEARPREATRT
jgi:hypothetical protein